VLSQNTQNCITACYCQLLTFFTHIGAKLSPLFYLFLFLFLSHNLIAGLGLPGFERSLPPGGNFIKLFWLNYIAIAITSVKIMGKYVASGVSYVL
jgi:hypothetical protein